MYVMEAVTQCQVLEISRTVGGEALSTPPVLPPHTLEKPAKENPRGKKTAMKWDLRWLLGSLRVFLSVEGNKGKDNDTGGREGDGEWCG